MEQVVYADPHNTEARALAAQAFEQLGYLAESATWRNAYLLGAQELRRDAPAPRRSPGVAPDMLHAMSLDLLFDHLGTRVNGPRAGAARMVINWQFSDTKESAASTLSHGALTAVIGKNAVDADATVTMPRVVFETVILRQRSMDDVIGNGDATIRGNARRVTQLIDVLDDFDPAFPLIEPRRR
jgi:alkyl sulfatase BDS1-like metallo-beta-lactamase superfamily hydrolase